MRIFSAHLGYLFTETPLDERFAAARRAGFAAVEHPAPYAMPAPAMRGYLRDEGLSLIQIALPAGEAGSGGKGMAALPGREVEFAESLKIGLDYAAAAGARFIQVQSGLIPPGVSPERLWETYLANLARSTDLAARAGVSVLIEPIGPGTLEGYFMSTSSLALRALAEHRAPNLGMLFDVFHEANAGADPVAFIRDHADKIAHLHIADFPGRHEPGSATLDFPSLFRVLDDAGYTGAIGCEYKPSSRTEDSLNWLAAHVT